jgi:GNAT superfamily N-acetyltransferase
MTLRPTTAADRPAILDHLRAHEASSIFPLANMIGTGPSPQQLWVAERGEGVVALGQPGFLMPQWPGLDPGQVLAALSGQRLSALIGPTDQVDPLLAALGLSPRHYSREPLCTLALNRLILPPAEGTRLEPPTPEDTGAVVEMRMAYDAETMAQRPQSARAKAESDVARWLGQGSHRLLWRQGQRVALSGLNARLADVVQVGGVFTPPALRSQGLARRAVAYHLAEARAAGALRAVLFAASAAALRAYQAIGFAQVGWMSLALLDRTVVVP